MDVENSREGETSLDAAWEKMQSPQRCNASTWSPLERIHLSVTLYNQKGKKIQPGSQHLNRCSQNRLQQPTGCGTVKCLSMGITKMSGTGRMAKALSTTVESIPSRVPHFGQTEGKGSCKTQQHLALTAPGGKPVSLQQKRKRGKEAKPWCRERASGA